MMHLLSGSDAVKFDFWSLKHFACQEHLLGTLNLLEKFKLHVVYTCYKTCHIGMAKSSKCLLINPLTAKFSGTTGQIAESHYKNGPVHITI